MTALFAEFSFSLPRTTPKVLLDSHVGFLSVTLLFSYITVSAKTMDLYFPFYFLGKWMLNCGF